MLILIQLSSHYGDLTVLVTKEYLFQRRSFFWKQRAAFLFCQICNNDCGVQDIFVVQEVFFAPSYVNHTFLLVSQNQ